MKHEFNIQKSADEEYMRVFLDNTKIISANHDNDGWHGMEAIEQTVYGIAKVIGAKVIHVNLDE